MTKPPPPPSRKMKSQERGIEEESLASPEKWNKEGKNKLKPSVGVE